MKSATLWPSALLALVLGGCASGPVTQPPLISTTDIENARVHLKTVRVPPSRQIDRSDMLAYIDRLRSQVDPHLLAICNTVFSSNCSNAISSVRYFVALDDMTINAYQSREGITFHAGLLHAAGSDDEVIAVWAHEVAHMLYSHLAKQSSNESLYGLAGLAIGLAIADEMFVHGMDPSIYTDLGQSGMDLGSDWGSHVYSPEMEIEADQFAIYVLKSGGWRVDAGMDFIARIHQGNVPAAVSNVGKGWAGLFRTHPPHDVRLASMAAESRRATTTGAIRPMFKSEHAVLKRQEILQVLKSDAREKWLSALEAEEPDKWLSTPGNDERHMHINLNGYIPQLKKESNCSARASTAFPNCAWWKGEQQESRRESECPFPQNVGWKTWKECVE